MYLHLNATNEQHRDEGTWCCGLTLGLCGETMKVRIRLFASTRNLAFICEKFV